MSVSQAMLAVRKATEENVRIASGVGANSQVSEAIEGVAAICQETSAGAQELSAITEEVAASASHLSDLASRLKEAAGRFQIEETSTPESHLRVA